MSRKGREALRYGGSLPAAARRVHPIRYRAHLKNPTTFAYIDLDRFGLRRPPDGQPTAALGSLEHRLTAGMDFQRQRDDRLTSTTWGQPAAAAARQLEHVTEFGPFIRVPCRSCRRCRSRRPALRLVNFQVHDRLVNDSNLTTPGRG